MMVPKKPADSRQKRRTERAMCRKSDASGNPVFPRTNSDRRFFSVRMGKTRNRKIIAAAALILSAGTMSCEKRQREPESREALGTVCSVNLYESGTESKYGKIFARLDEIDALFNLSSPASDISRVNAARGAPVEVAPDFIKVLSEALEIARVTEGAFNPALGSVTELWRNAKIHTDRIPSKTEIRNALAHADFRKIRLDEQAGTVCMGDAEAKLDLNAIAKGFAADSIAEILAQGNVKGATVNLGGHIYVFGTKKDRSPWKLGIKNPNAPEGIPAVSISGLQDTAVVTSGIYDGFFTNGSGDKNAGGVFFHHIIDPATGFPADNGILSMTVVCRNAAAADALGTAFFVMGKEKSFAMMGEGAFDPVAGGRPLAVSITNDARISASRGLEGYIGVVLNDYTISFR